MRPAGAEGAVAGVDAPDVAPAADGVVLPWALELRVQAPMTPAAIPAPTSATVLPRRAVNLDIRFSFCWVAERLLGSDVVVPAGARPEFALGRDEQRFVARLFVDPPNGVPAQDDGGRGVRVGEGER